MMFHGAVGYLLTAGAGYLVLERADKQKGSLRRIGQWVGAVIVILSLLGSACAIGSGLAQCSSGSRKMGGFCPIMGKPHPFAPAQ